MIGVALLDPLIAGETQIGTTRLTLLFGLVVLMAYSRQHANVFLSTAVSGALVGFIAVGRAAGGNRGVGFICPDMISQLAGHSAAGTGRRVLTGGGLEGIVMHASPRNLVATDSTGIADAGEVAHGHGMPLRDAARHAAAVETLVILTGVLRLVVVDKLVGNNSVDYRLAVLTHDRSLTGGLHFLAVLVKDVMLALCIFNQRATSSSSTGKLNSTLPAHRPLVAGGRQDCLIAGTARFQSIIQLSTSVHSLAIFGACCGKRLFRHQIAVIMGELSPFIIHQVACFSTVHAIVIRTGALERIRIMVTGCRYV